MATRTTHMGNAVASEVLTAANYNKNAGGWLGHVTSTSNQTFDDSPEIDVTDLSMSITVPAGRKLMFGGFVTMISTVDQDNVRVRVYRDSTGIEAFYWECDTNASTSAPIYAIDTPSAGTYTYKVSLVRAAGSGTVTLTGSFGHVFYCIDIGSSS